MVGASAELDRHRAASFGERPVINGIVNCLRLVRVPSSPLGRISGSFSDRFCGVVASRVQ